VPVYPNAVGVRSYGVVPVLVGNPDEARPACRLRTGWSQWSAVRS